MKRAPLRTDEDRSKHLVACLEYTRRKATKEVSILVDQIIEKSSEVLNIDYAEVDSTGAVEMFKVDRSHYVFWLEQGDIHVSVGKFSAPSQTRIVGGADELITSIISWSRDLPSGIVGDSLQKG